MAYTVAQLKSFRKSAKSKRSTFKNRRNKVQSAQNNVYKMDDYASKIQRKVDDCTDDLREGIKGITAVSTKCNNISSYKERCALSSQSPYNDAIWNINQEVSRCDSEINTLDYKISNYERQIREQGGTLMPWE